eukprot:jgi/Bigna1/86176/estExt_fgenesh1_pg.C_80252
MHNTQRTPSVRTDHRTPMGPRTALVPTVLGTEANYATGSNRKEVIVSWIPDKSTSDTGDGTLSGMGYIPENVERIDETDTLEREYIQAAEPGKMVKISKAEKKAGGNDIMKNKVETMNIIPTRTLRQKEDDDSAFKWEPYGWTKKHDKELKKAFKAKKKDLRLVIYMNLFSENLLFGRSNGGGDDDDDGNATSPFLFVFSMLGGFELPLTSLLADVSYLVIISARIESMNITTDRGLTKLALELFLNFTGSKIIPYRKPDDTGGNDGLEKFAFTSSCSVTKGYASVSDGQHHCDLDLLDREYIESLEFGRRYAGDKEEMQALIENRYIHKTSDEERQKKIEAKRLKRKQREEDPFEGMDPNEYIKKFGPYGKLEVDDKGRLHGQIWPETASDESDPARYLENGILNPIWAIKNWRTPKWIKKAVGKPSDTTDSYTVRNTKIEGFHRDVIRDRLERREMRRNKRKGGEQYWRMYKNKTGGGSMGAAHVSSDSGNGYVGADVMKNRKLVWGENDNGLMRNVFGRATMQGGNYGDEILNPDLMVREWEPTNPSERRMRWIDKFLARKENKISEQDDLFRRYEDNVGQYRADASHRAPVLSPALVRKMERVRRERREKAEAENRVDEEDIAEIMKPGAGAVTSDIRQRQDGAAMGQDAEVADEEDELENEAQREMREFEETVPASVRRAVEKDFGKDPMHFKRGMSQIERTKFNLENDPDREIPYDLDQYRARLKQERIQKEVMMDDDDFSVPKSPADDPIEFARQRRKRLRGD